MSVTSLRGAVNWALMVALVLGAGAMAQAQEENESDGKVVRIGSSDGEKAPSNDESGRRVFNPQAEMPKYWIGLMGGPIETEHPLRAHVELPEGEGLLVVDVVAEPASPASKAGLKKHDILLRANGVELRDMKELVGMVASEGEKKGQIKLDILRHNKHETVSITPEDRPANAPMPQPNLNFGDNTFNFQGGDPNQLRDLFKQFGGEFPPQFRNFGNGVIVGGGVPNGVSISVQKQDGQPTQVTVKRGEETWTVSGDDTESLKQVPEDLRPMVERILRGNTGMQFNFPPNFEQRLGERFNDGGLRERLEQMEKRMEEMQKRLGDSQAESNDEANK
jgi:hypothetical protein